VIVEPAGRCFSYAHQRAKEAFKSGEYIEVLHGTVEEPYALDPKRYDHAWVEKEGVVYDWQIMKAGMGGKFTGLGMPVEVFYELYKPEDVKKYTPEQVIVNSVKYGHYGPWGEEMTEKKCPHTFVVWGKDDKGVCMICDAEVMKVGGKVVEVKKEGSGLKPTAAKVKEKETYAASEEAERFRRETGKLDRWAYQGQIEEYIEEPSELEKKAGAIYIRERLLQPFYEEEEERAKALGYASVKDYEEAKEAEFKEGSLFDGVVIFPLDQSQVLEEFEAAVEDPEIMPTGMTDPIDFALGNYMEMVRDNEKGGGFVGYRSRVGKELVRREAQPQFPTGNYEVNYAAVKALIQENNWRLSSRGWTYEG
jgi:hypothetical protein